MREMKWSLLNYQELRRDLLWATLAWWHPPLLSVHVSWLGNIAFAHWSLGLLANLYNSFTHMTAAIIHHCFLLFLHHCWYVTKPQVFACLFAFIFPRLQAAWGQERCLLYPPLYTQSYCNKYLLTNDRTTQHQLAASSHAFPDSLFLINLLGWHSI